MLTTKIIPLLIYLAASFAFAGSNTLSWERIKSWSPGKNGPAGREHPLFFKLPEFKDLVFIYGGQDFSTPQQMSLNDLWALNLRTGKWSLFNQKGQSPLALGRGVLSKNSKEFIVTGGILGNLPRGDIYTLKASKNSVQWAKLDAEMPLPKYLHSLVSVTGTPYYLSFGGVSSSEGNQFVSPLVSLISFGSNGKSKTIEEQVLSQDGITGRYGFAYAYDSKHQRLIVVGGQGPIGLDDQGNVINQQDAKTYEFRLSEENPVWKVISGAEIEARRNPCWAHDTRRNYFFVFGGTSDGKNAIPGLLKLDLNQENPTWEKLTPSGEQGAPVPRGSCVGLYDEVQDQILFGFGNILNTDQTAIEPMTDVWRLKHK